MTIEKRYVAKVDFAIDFAYASTRLGYGTEQLSKMNFTLGERLIDTVARLAGFAEERRYFEIYTENHEEGWGRLKATDSLKEDGRARAGLGFYGGFFHGRAIAGKQDPLIVISFRGEIIPPPVGYDSAYEQAVFHGIADHKVLFADGDEKYHDSGMRNLRERNSRILNIRGETQAEDTCDGNPDSL